MFLRVQKPWSFTETIQVDSGWANLPWRLRSSLAHTNRRRQKSREWRRSLWSRLRLNEPWKVRCRCTCNGIKSRFATASTQLQQLLLCHVLLSVPSGAASKSTADAEEMQRRQAWAEKVPPEPDGSMQASQVKVLMGDNKVTRRFGSGSFSTSECSAWRFRRNSAVLTKFVDSCVYCTCRRDLGGRGAVDQLAEFDCIRPVQCRRVGFMGLHVAPPENTRLHRRGRGKDTVRFGL
eukprot:COSAG02_NODE_3531_length_6606_cov_67.718611_5_plen_235_part_00